MKVPVSMIPTSGAGAVVAAIILVALVVYAAQQPALPTAPNTPR